MYRRWQGREPGEQVVGATIAMPTAIGDSARVPLSVTLATLERKTETPKDLGRVLQEGNTIPNYSKMTQEELQASAICLPCWHPPISSQCERVAQGRLSKSTQVLSALHMIIHPGC